MTVVALRETPRRITDTEARPDDPFARPEPPFVCGHYGVARWYAPEKWSDEWLDDPCKQWQCPACSRCLGPGMVYAGVGPLTDEDLACLRAGLPLTEETQARLSAACAAGY